MKKLTILIAFFFSSFLLKAQEEYKDIIYRATNADYIFEGVVIKTNPYKTTDDKRIYTSNTIQITKVLKGDLQCGTVELITVGGFVENEQRGTTASHTLEVSEKSKGIFLCSQTGKELSAVDFYPESNYQKLEATFEEQSFIKYWYDGQGIKASDMWYNFDSLAQIYDLAQYLPMLNLIDCNNASLLYEGNNNHFEEESSNYQFPVYSRSKYDSTIAFMQWKSENAPKQSNGNRANKTLAYSISNPIITGGATKYFEFDVNLADDVGNVYFNQGLIRLNYSSSVFGSNIVTNNKIAVNRGYLISDPITYADPTPADISANEIAIPLSIEVPITNLNLTPLPNTPTQAVHIKMEIQNCNATGSISFTSQSIMEILSWYGTAYNDTFGENYDNVAATQTVNKPACKTTITSFNSPVNGGVGDILEIKGFQFGATKGVGNVYLKNADNGGLSELPSEDSDFILWSDTLIKMKVPSVDTGIFQAVGSGKFRVVSNSGSADTSDTDLHIFYSLQNYRNDTVFNGEKKLLLLYNKDNNGGYKFYVDTIISHNPAALSCVRKAIKDWVCETGVNFQLVGDTFGLPNTVSKDGINLITFGPLNTLGTTYNHSARCQSTGIFINTEIDIIFNIAEVPSFHYDSTGTQTIPVGKRDFYFLLLHEIGHAVKHNHVNDYNAIMYYAARNSLAPSGLTPPDRKVELWQDNSGVLGGQRSVNFAANGSLVTGCSLTPMQPYNTNICGLYNRIHNIDNSTFNFSAYPNPFSDGLTIDLFSERNNVVSFSIVNLTGQVVKSYEAMPLSLGENSLKLETAGISGGIYLLVAKVNGVMSVKKLIREHE